MILKKTLKKLLRVDIDHKKKEFKKRKEEYGKYGNDVLLLEKNLLFKYRYVTIPFFLVLGGLLLISVGSLLLIDSIKVSLIIMGVYLLFSIYKGLGILKKYLDYHLDYIIVSVEKLRVHEQTGLFKSVGKDIGAFKLEETRYEQDGFFQSSLFKYGTIYFISEGDDKTNKAGQMIADFVDNPKRKVKEIEKILEYEAESNYKEIKSKKAKELKEKVN